MFSGERSRAENIEEKRSPEKAVGNAVSPVENKDAEDSVISSGWAQKAKGYFKSKTKEFFDPKENWEDAKGVGKFAGSAALFGGVSIAKMFWGLLKFAKKAIEKGGNVGFEGGYKIAQESFESKGNKK